MLPDDAAVLVAQDQHVDRSFSQTIRSFCDVPVASAPTGEPLGWYQELARRWRTEGRTLWMVSESESFGPAFAGFESTRVADFRVRELELVLNQRPRSFVLTPFRLFVTRVPL